MKRIILFRFHKEPEICENRLIMLKRFNPGVAIFGLYGGTEKDFGKFDCLAKYLKNIFAIENKTSEWKWKNGDLGVRMWFDAIGRNADFEMVHLIEWDLLLFDSLENIYGAIPRNGIGLTGLIELGEVESRWVWTSGKEERPEWVALLEFAKDRYGYKNRPCASLAPGYCLPRNFLADYRAAEIPELCHDELRLPLFGQIFGYKLFDTGFYRKWFDDNEHKYFNCMNLPIGGGIIGDELRSDVGRRVFHPCRDLIDLK